MSFDQTIYRRHYEDSAVIPAGAAAVFALIDDHNRLSSHMSKSSWMMGGGRMETSVDAGHGQKVGSHIRMSGTAFGINIYLDEVITRHEPPSFKTWETVGIPKLLIIGSYRMGVEIRPHDGHSLLRVFIDYNLPDTNAWLGRLFGGLYAKWCVRQMVKDANGYFTAQWYQCKECGFRYAEKEWAEKCEAWCKEHRSCNLEITAHGIAPHHSERG